MSAPMRCGVIETLRRAAEQVPAVPLAEIPDAIAEAARLQALLSVALAKRTEAPPAPAPPGDHEQLVSAPEAAARLGVTEDWIRRHTEELPFMLRLGRKVRFSLAGIDRYVRLRESR